MPNFKSANWLATIAELQSLDMTGSEDGVWIRTATEDDGVNWFDIGTTIDWFDIGTTIDWFDFAGAGGTGVSSENWIGWTWRKNATGGLAATGGGYWIPANNGTITFEGGGAGGGLDEAAVLAIAEGAIADRLPLDWTSDINSKPATYPPSVHNHVFTDIAGVAPLIHTHLVTDITNISTWLSAQTINFSQITGMVYPDPAVVSVNGLIGVVELTALDIGAASLVHVHLNTDIVNWDSAFEISLNSLFPAAVANADIDYPQLTNVPFALTNFTSIMGDFETGFLYKSGVDVISAIESTLLLDIAGFLGPSPASGYVYFDGTNMVLESANDQDLLSQIAVMVSAAWEQVKEEVTFGKVPNRNFIHLH